MKNKRWIVLGLFLSLLSLQCSGDEASKKEEKKKPEIKKVLPDPSFFAVTKGIVGGFVPPHTSWQFLIEKKREKEEAFVWMMKNPQEANEASYTKGQVPYAELVKLLTKADKMKLWEFPLEKPREGEDIYGLDTSLHAHQGKKFWVNLGPAGIHSPSEVRANKKQKESFAKMVTLLKETAEKHAQEKSTEEEFGKAIERANPYMYLNEGEGKEE